MGKDGLEDFSIEELEEELARRRVGDSAGSLRDFEVATEEAQQRRTQSEVQRFLNEKADAEDDEPKPCPRCGRPCRVRARGRTRTLQAVCGELSLSRNYHYCERCEGGFYPLDEELELPEDGQLTREMERRVLDFGVNDTFEEAADRWSMHYGSSISSNLVRRVVERQGCRLEEAEPERVQEEALPSHGEPPETLAVYVDGSMVLTRDGWREVKLATIVRSDQHLPGTEKRRGIVSEARYVAHLGSVDEFRNRLDAALRAADAAQAERVLCYGDGAPWIWNLTDELCPDAAELLDWRHLQELAHDCAEALFGEGTDLAQIWSEQFAKLAWAQPDTDDAGDETSLQPLDAEDVIELGAYRSPTRPADFLANPAADAPGHIRTLLSQLDECWALAETKQQRDALKSLADYIHRNRNRMNYREFQERGDPTGSGTGESAHKHVIQVRMKRAGQHWDADRGDRMAQLRAMYRTAGPAHFFDTIERAAA